VDIVPQMVNASDMNYPLPYFFILAKVAIKLREVIYK
jgi:hypothetical protein